MPIISAEKKSSKMRESNDIYSIFRKSSIFGQFPRLSRSINVKNQAKEMFPFQVTKIYTLNPLSAMKHEVINHFPAFFQETTSTVFEVHHSILQEHFGRAIQEQKALEVAGMIISQNGNITFAKS